MASASFKAILISINILLGGINTVSYKMQNKTLVYEGSYYKYFFHPYMQTIFMFVGEALALLVYFIMKNRDREGYRSRMLEAKSKGKEINMNKLLYAIPAAADAINSTTSYIALNFITGSIWQMFRGGSIIATFLLSICMLKTKPKGNQIIGTIFAFVGIVIVGISSLAFAQDSSSTGTPGQQIIGYLLMIICLIATGFIMTFEQKLMMKYHIQPLQMVGFEGCFGIAIQLVVIIIFSLMPCSFGADACVMRQAGGAFMENPLAYFQQVFSNGVLLLFVLISIVSMSSYNVTGVTVTKHINALARSIADASRTVLVWVISIIITVTLGASRPNYVWELTSTGAVLVELLGFAFLVFGNLVYNQIIKLPCLKQQTKNPLMLESDEDSGEIRSQEKGPSLLTQP